MHSYLIVIIIAAIYCFISFVYEIMYEPEKQMMKGSFNYNVYLRFVHSILFVYATFYFIIFLKNDITNHYIFAVVIFIILLSWRYFGHCIMSCYEWRFYKNRLQKIPITSNLVTNIFDCLSSMCYVNYIHIILGAINVIYALYFMNIHLLVKMSYVLISGSILLGIDKNDFFPM